MLMDHNPKTMYCNSIKNILKGMGTLFSTHYVNTITRLTFYEKSSSHNLLQQESLEKAGADNRHFFYKP